LEASSDNHDEHEDPAGEWFFEKEHLSKGIVVIWANNAAIPLIEPAKLHESVENDGKVSALVNSSLGKLTIHALSGLSRSFVGKIEHFLSSENHDAHDNGVPKGNTVNLSPDSLSHNLGVL